LLTLPARISSVKANHCEHCHGHYVDSVSLRGYLNDRAIARSFERLLQLARDGQPSRRGLECPVCRTHSYHEIRREGVHLDVCATCGGLYFDGGEAEVYLRKVREPQPSRPAADRAFGADDGAILVSELFGMFY